MRISYPQSIHQQVEAAALASTLLAAILPSSLSHPQRAIDTAAYTPVHIGGDREGDSNVTGKDVFRDPYELNLPDVLLGLEAVCRTLVNAGARVCKERVCYASLVPPHKIVPTFMQSL